MSEAPPAPSLSHRISLGWDRWWRRLKPQQQDRFASLLPLLAVLLFIVTVGAAMGYLLLEEQRSQQQAIQRDGEYSRQRVNVRLAERQEQLQKLGRDMVAKNVTVDDFDELADRLLADSPELRDLTWVDARQHVIDSRDLLGVPNSSLPSEGEPLPLAAERGLLERARELLQPVYGLIRPGANEDPLLALAIPLYRKTELRGYLYARYTLSSLLYYAVPSDVYARYAVALTDRGGAPLVGQSPGVQSDPPPWPAPWPALRRSRYLAPLAPLGNDLSLQLRTYRAAGNTASRGLLLLVLALSGLTTWMLLANWRHLRRRLRSQRALQTETQFRRAMENSLVTGMRALDMDGRISHVNAAFCQMTGWSEQELIGQVQPYSFWHPDDYQINENNLGAMSRQVARTTGHEMRVLRKNGTTFEARMYIAPLIGGDGVQTGWISSMTDITEPNRIKRQLTNAYERFTRVLDAIDATISVAPLGGTELLFANRAYRQWFGNEDNANGHMQLLARAGSVAAARHDARELEDNLMGLPTADFQDAATSNSEIYLEELGKWVEVRSRYLEWVDGRLAQMLIATDITARRQAEELSAQQAARAQAASRLVTMGEMASSVAHELNQPLTAIANYCSGMIARLRNGPMEHDALVGAIDKTARQAQRAGHIIQRIRAFVRRSKPNYSPANVQDMVEEAMELAEIEMRRRQVQIRWHVAPRLPALLADKLLIEQVLINLLKNGAEAIDQAQLPPERRRMALDVLRNVRDGNPVIEFTITDSGPGLSSETLEHLFEAFFTTKAEGLGIGLNLCRSIVESHHGRLLAENLYNRDGSISGCRFTFWIPLPGRAPAAASDSDS